MKSLNLKHLQYFWLTAREGSISKACDILDLAPQTLSAQIATLEENVNHMLFKREGRNLVLTPMGKQVFTYADKIFDMSAQLEAVLEQPADSRSLDLTVGIAATVHKILAWKVIKPALDIPNDVQLVCRTGNGSDLLLHLKQKKIDLLITDYLPHECDREGLAYEKILSTSMSFFFHSGDIAQQLKQGFPESLSDQPFLSYGRQTPYLDKLKDWFKDNAIRLNLKAEIDDSALLKVLGQSGEGFFSAPTVIAEEICHQYHVDVIGQAPSITEDLYAIYRESSLINPAVEKLLNFDIEQQN
ncbi:MAG: LysR substrate-binding domain-containing protein [Amphritea sp.]|nr:LysR substrate-binding domain-containing protein [Amphritea sp.]